ncbi:hypothetical protein [Lichenicoccus roseus]|uniref:Uncharacterized protein n=1 Tax=Lichenicoccus roseus TaxID=2683649 RepID=A0A5R9J2A5_9PROT|nr:hypothetical protein [Lichenicoccus roseus]TLU71099.1 hypothetical protein FE263_18155 [Lichenicoccus roseus]
MTITPDLPPAGVSACLRDTIEIELPGGSRVRVSSNVKAQALRLVMDAPEQVSPSVVPSVS